MLDEPIIWESVVTSSSSKGARLPRPAMGAQAHYILERLASLSRPFGTTIEITGDTGTIRPTR